LPLGTDTSAQFIHWVTLVGRPIFTTEVGVAPFLGGMRVHAVIVP
jgi:hypothetical protein